MIIIYARILSHTRARQFSVSNLRRVRNISPVSFESAPRAYYIFSRPSNFVRYIFRKNHAFKMFVSKSRPFSLSLSIQFNLQFRSNIRVCDKHVRQRALIERVAERGGKSGRTVVFLVSNGFVFISPYIITFWPHRRRVHGGYGVKAPAK